MDHRFGCGRTCFDLSGSVRSLGLGHVRNSLQLDANSSAHLKDSAKSANPAPIADNLIGSEGPIPNA